MQSSGWQSNTPPFMEAFDHSKPTLLVHVTVRSYYLSIFEISIVTSIAKLIVRWKVCVRIPNWRLTCFADWYRSLFDCRIILAIVIIFHVRPSTFHAVVPVVRNDLKAQEMTLLAILNSFLFPARHTRHLFKLADHSVGYKAMQMVSSRYISG